MDESKVTKSTHVYKKVGDLELSLDVISPSTSSPDSSKTVLIHYHGGFLVVGDKQTFAPAWLIGASLRRGWTYVTPNYRLLPEASGHDVLGDALDAAAWCAANLGPRLVLAGSSAGGFLAVATASQLASSLQPAPQPQPQPLAVLSVYGMLDLAHPRYTTAGTPLMQQPPLPAAVTDILLASLAAATETVDPAKQSAGYPFPANPQEDPRMHWIAALHQAARFPDTLARAPGLAARIKESGPSAIRADQRVFFPLEFGIREAGAAFPPTALLHGDADVAVGVEQSQRAAEKLRAAGVEVLLEEVDGKGHGFDVREVPAGVDVEEDGEGKVEESVRKALRSVVAFLDKAVTAAAARA